MNPSDWLIRGRQLFAFLVPGAVWTFSGLMLLSIPLAPADLMMAIRPSWVEAAVFIGLSYVVGVALQKISLWFAEGVTRRASVRFPRLFADRAMKRRANQLQNRVRAVVMGRYKDCSGFELGDRTRLFGFTKRILRASSPSLYAHLDVYEEEINLIGLLPLPLVIFPIVWCVCWLFADPTWETWVRYIIPFAILAWIIAVMCLLQFRPLRLAERKEVFESFLAFHLESQQENQTKGS